MNMNINTCMTKQQNMITNMSMKEQMMRWETHCQTIQCRQQVSRAGYWYATPKVQNRQGTLHNTGLTPTEYWQVLASSCFCCADFALQSTFTAV